MKVEHLMKVRELIVSWTVIEWMKVEQAMKF